MSKKVTELCKNLADKIKSSYEESITIETAEKLAGEFLHAQLLISEELRNKDLDSRMKKNGLKQVKAAVYLNKATETDKKPSDVLIQAVVDRDELVAGEQKSFDEAEVDRDLLQNYLNIFKDAHIHFRSIAKGRFE